MAGKVAARTARSPRARYRAAAAAGFAVVLALSGCAETELVASAAKQINQQQYPRPVGRYKVGRPYQIGGVWYYPAVDEGYVETGIASWYGPNFHNKKTANGEVFDQNDLTAAHRTLPMPSIVRVTNLENGRALVLRINDRGPFAHGRIIDVSRRGAQLLGFEQQGTARVKVEILPAESHRAVELAKNGQPYGVIPAAVTAPAPQAAPRQTVQAESIASAPAPVSPPPVLRKPPSAVELTRQAGQQIVQQEPVRPTQLYVQVAAFSDPTNARKLESRLAGFDMVDTHVATVSGQQFHRVRIGPLASVDRADQVLERVIGLGFPAARVVVD